MIKKFKSIFDIYFTTKKSRMERELVLYMTKIIIEQNLGGKKKQKIKIMD